MADDGLRVQTRLSELWTLAEAKAALDDIRDALASNEGDSAILAAIECIVDGGEGRPSANEANASTRNEGPDA
jgi:hypothetical protein